MRVKASKPIAVIGCLALLATAACGNNAANNAASSTTSSAAASSEASSAAGSESSGAAASGSSAGSSSAESSGSSAGSATATGGSGAAGGSGAPTKNPATDGQTINVLMVNNPQMVDLQKLTADNFTEGDRHQGELHRPAGERRPRQDRPGVLQTRPASTTSPRCPTSRSRSTPRTAGWPP